MTEHKSKKSTGSSDALKNIILESIKSKGLDFEEISKDKMNDGDEWSFVVYGIVYSLFIRALKSQPTTLQLEYRIELDSEEQDAIKKLGKGFTNLQQRWNQTLKTWGLDSQYFYEQKDNAKVTGILLVKMMEFSVLKKDSFSNTVIRMFNLGDEFIQLIRNELLNVQPTPSNHSEETVQHDFVFEHPLETMFKKLYPLPPFNYKLGNSDSYKSKNKHTDGKKTR